MKTLIALTLLATSAFIAQAQTTTNVTVKWTVDYVTASTTNTVNSTIKLTPGTSTKDANRVAGLSFAWATYQATLATNVVPAAFELWMKTNYTALVENYSQQAQAAKNMAIAAKIQTLLTSQSDLLSAAELNNLATIAAKAQ